MADSHAAGHNCFLDVAAHVVLGLAGVVALPQTNGRVATHHPLNYLVVLLEAAVEVFLLEEVDADGPGPVELAQLAEVCLDGCLGKGLPEAEDEAH